MSEAPCFKMFLGGMGQQGKTRFKITDHPPLNHNLLVTWQGFLRVPQKGGVIKGGVSNANERAQTQTNADFRLSPKTQVDAHKRAQTQTNADKRKIEEFHPLLLTAFSGTWTWAPNS